jgi:hypothetical protein
MVRAVTIALFPLAYGIEDFQPVDNSNMLKQYFTNDKVLDGIFTLYLF